MVNPITRLVAFIEKVNASPEKLGNHILHTYVALRWSMVGLGLILPPLLVFGGLNSLWWLSEPLDVQNSLSAYYHAGPGLECTALEGGYRDLFVGLLTAISACLIIYSGFNSLEEWLLNFAGVFLAGVAFFPTSWPETQLLVEICEKTTQDFQPFQASKLFGLPVSLHVASAVLFFLTITAVNVLTAMNTVKRIKNEAQKRFWEGVFKFAMWLMPIFIGLVLLVRLFTGTSIIGEQLILWIEWAGIWSFSLYWLLKSIEILSTGVEGDWV
ncbi:hypothetical protein IQ260_07175 [Leptolyngbya cf. ectocarpi LEGE 11479]|uniref:Uncharacterized protein n=1 Tax=Leptolyngbya cf. ectocarpi LEGE 11479 TaxID=1828722 RepID=A0A928ZT55_LEPEC|nr:hypothetical protein [Leptolyngbya ectocarpi]MBE9066431.1 hypothetical protein [Leptolyngbya cf. ectocarpi LEGE 11479]